MDADSGRCRHQGYATSATLSRGGESGAEITALRIFGAGMFGKSEDGVKVVVGERYRPQEGGPARPGAPRLRVPADPHDGIAPGMRTLIYGPDGSPERLLVDRGLADLAGRACVSLGVATDAEVEATPQEVRACPALLLHALLSTHGEVIRLREWLFEAEKRGLPTLEEVAQRVFDVSAPSEAELRAASTLLRLGSLARLQADRLPFIPARMHAFMRAPVGVWLTPKGGAGAAAGDWSSAEMSSGPSSGDPAAPPRLQLLTCTSCGGPYLEAWEEHDGWGEVRIVTQPSPGAQVVALAYEPESDLRLSAELGGIPVRKASIAVVRNPREVMAPGATDTAASARLICVHCGDDQARLSALRIAARSATGAIVDAIYPHLNEHPGKAAKGRRLPGGGRRLLTFSDSRQETARIAAEVEASHDIGVNRRLLLDRLNPGEIVTVRELLNSLPEHEREIRERAAARGLSQELLVDLANICVYQELARPPARGKSLETLGLVEVIYPNLPARPGDVTVLTDDEWHAVLANVLDDARRRGAVRKPRVSRSAEDDYQLDQLLPPTLDRSLVWTVPPAEAASEDEENDDPALLRIPLYPVQNPERSRIVRYLGRLVGDASVTALLRSIWEALVELARNPRCHWLKQASNDEVEALRIHLEHLSLRRHEVPPFIEPASRRLYFRSIRGVPLERGAREELRPLLPPERKQWLSSHALRRILEEPMMGLHAAEHTAQIDVDELEAQEAEFREGKLNLLASSTTMEMGVDLGGLTFVLMTNAPPGPANYWQRAGRAGRRADGSSMALTLTLARPHDQKVFYDPRAFLSGEVTPPRVRLDTPPLLLRHTYAFLLAGFLNEAILPAARGNPMKAFGTVEEFLFKAARDGNALMPGIVQSLALDDEDPLSIAFLRWLQQLDPASSVANALKRLAEGTALATWTIHEIAASAAAAFEDAIRDAQEDREVIRSQRQEEMKKGEGSRDDRFLKSLDHQERQLLRETMIAYLSRTDFLPRFGFPVGVVKLDTVWKKTKREEADERDDERQALPDLRMERSLDIALSEYVPGADVIAGMRVFRSAGLIRNWLQDEPGMARRRFFMECRRCGAVEDRAAQPEKCSVCGHPAIKEETFRKNEAAAEKQLRRSRGSDAPPKPDPSDEPVPPSPVRQYLVPSSFAVQYGRPPRRVSGSADRMPYARVSLAVSGSDTVTEVIPGAVAASFAPESRLFIRSEGLLMRGGLSGFGFAICQVCGRAEPEKGFDKAPDVLRRHRKLRGGGECSGGVTKMWRNSVLGTSATVDAFRVRLLGDLAPSLSSDDEESFYMTLAVCLQQVAARRLQVDERVIGATVSAYRTDEPGPHTHRREAVLYDEAGSGLLAHLAEDPASLVRDAVRLVLEGREADFIRFDSQFLAIAGKLRIDLLRSHFADPARVTALDAPSFFSAFHARALRGRGARTAVLEMLADATAEVALVAKELAIDAFDRDGILRAVRRAALSHRTAPPRLLLETLPQHGRSTDEALLAGQLAALIEDGAVVRVATSLEPRPWQALCRRRGRVEAVGALVAQSAEKATPFQAPAFGPWWLRGAIVVEPASSADTIWQAFESDWAAARAVTRQDVTPKPADRTHFVPIREGSTDAASTDLHEIFSSKLGPTKDLGEVIGLIYSDRYVERSPVGMRNLDLLLQLFRYASGAKAVVLTEGPKGKKREGRKPEDILGASTTDELSDNDSEEMKRWIIDRTRGSVDVSFVARKKKDKNDQSTTRLRHTRKLLVKFAPGSPMQTLKVLFEHGLDWVHPLNGTGAWTTRPLRAEETHLVMITDHLLDNERDENGVSEWHAHFPQVE